MSFAATPRSPRASSYPAYKARHSRLQLKVARSINLASLRKNARKEVAHLCPKDESDDHGIAPRLIKLAKSLNNQTFSMQTSTINPSNNRFSRRARQAAPCFTTPLLTGSSAYYKRNLYLLPTLHFSMTRLSAELFVTSCSPDLRKS